MSKVTRKFTKLNIAKFRHSLATSVVISTLAVVGPLWGQTTTAANSNPLGMYKLGAYDASGNYIGLQANSDTLVSLPFVRAPEFIGAVSSVSGSSVTVTGTPGWSSSQFVYNATAIPPQTKTYFALIGAGANGATNPKEGCIYTVSANSANALTLTLNGDDISQIPAGSQVTLIPYWTLSTMFPASSAGLSYTATTSTRTLETEVLTPNYSGVGVNLSNSSAYFYINSGSNVGWRLFGDLTTKNHGDDILLPDGYFTVRNQNGAPTLPLTVWGTVVTGKVTVPQATAASASQDNSLAMIRPIGVSLNNTGLSPSNGSFVATTSTRTIKDEIFVYNNSAVSFNKSPTLGYYYMNNAWRLFGDLVTNDHGADIIPACNALIIRKAATGNGQTVFWTNGPTY